MTTIRESIQQGEPLFYHGDRGGWLRVYTNADPNADTVAASNIRSIARELGVESTERCNLYADPATWMDGSVNPDDTAAIELYGGAFGTGQWLLVRPGSPAAERVEEILEELEDYPLFDEEDHSELEFENAVWGLTEEIYWRYRDVGLVGMSREVAEDIAERYISLHDYGTDAGYSFDNTAWSKLNQRDRDTLAQAIKEWRRDRHN